MAILQQVSGSTAGQFIELKVEVVDIGRSPDCKIVLEPNGVSRRHAEIRRSGDGHTIVDLTSRNKTKVNNVELVPDKPQRLRPGDKINICDVEFIYYTQAPKPAAPKSRGNELIVTEEASDEANIQTIDASRSSAVTSVVRPEVKLKAILEIARNLSTELKIDTLAPKILESLMQLFPQAERLFLILKDPDSGKLVRKAFKHRPTRRSGLFKAQEDEAPISISRTIVNHVLGQKKALLSQDAGNDANLPTTSSIADLKIRSVMCVPLLTPDGQALGIIQLDTSDSRQFNQDDLDLLAAVAGQAAIAVQNASLHESLIERERIERDLRLAEQVQKRFLPKSTPVVPGYQFFAHYDPAYEVGGDYYLFVELPGDRVAIALGDVSGKGVAAALMMAKFSGETRYAILTEPTPSAAANKLNKLLYEADIEEKFITLSLSVLDPALRTLTVCSAGHLPILIRRASGRVEECGEELGGLPLGILPESDYQQTVIPLEPGDVVVINSDGVTDARSVNEEIYEKVDNRRLLKRVAAVAGGAEVVGRAILQDVREFSAGHAQADDITLICFGPSPE